MPLSHIMLDAETLSTRPDACIISVGAVRFDINTGEIEDAGFYRSISVDSNKGRHISESTLVWWMQQNVEAQKVFTEPKVPLLSALSDLSEFITASGPDVKMWSNGADFDIPMFAHALDTNGIEVPWKFWNSNCYRTYKKLPGAPKMQTQATVKHNALQDAYVQAVHLCQIHANLFSRENMKASKV